MQSLELTVRILAEWYKRDMKQQISHNSFYQLADKLVENNNREYHD